MESTNVVTIARSICEKAGTTSSQPNHSERPIPRSWRQRAISCCARMWYGSGGACTGST